MRSKQSVGYPEAEKLKALIFKRTGLPSSELTCPREKSEMTPCVARDGGLAVCDINIGDADRALIISRRTELVCVGCEAKVAWLLDQEDRNGEA